MKLSTSQIVLLSVAGVLLLLVLVFASFRGCDGGEPVILISQGIDAGPGEAEISARLDAEVQAGRARIEQIEEKFEDDMAAFDAQQRREYEQLRGGDDLEAAARFLSDWARTRQR